MKSPAQTKILQTSFFVFFLLFHFSTQASPPTIIDNFSYNTSSEAQQVWENGYGHPKAIMSSSGEWGEKKVMVLPIEYETSDSRNFWDGYFSLDLTLFSNFSLDIYVSDHTKISYFTLYFHADGVWTAESISVSQSGWQTWDWDKDDFEPEVEPFQWDQVDRIRFSPWKDNEGECFLALKKLDAYIPEILLVEGTLSTSEKSSTIYADQIMEILSSWNLYAGKTNDVLVESGILNNAQIAILPYNDNMSSAELAALDTFAAGGGKIISFYNLNSTLAKTLGIRDVAWMPQDYPGQFSSMIIDAPDIPGLPDEVYQGSHNIRLAQPDSPDAKRIAYWEDSEGNLLSYPAILLSNTGAFFSHVFTSNDMDKKELLLLGLLGHFRPETWKEASNAALDKINNIANHHSYESLVTFIQNKAQGHPKSGIINAFLNNAESLHQDTIVAISEENHFEAIQLALECRENLLEAYYYCQTPQDNEFRAWWEHSGLGAYAGDWEKSMQNLSVNGFNNIVPNMLWGGSSLFSSSYLPQSEDFTTYGDQIIQCVSAAKKYDIGVHVWKVNWNFSTRAPQIWVDSMRAAERTQVDVFGEPNNWLCPSHPDNLALERDSMLEIAQNYDVQGIHFDYIRYPGNTFCYCDGCQQRFEEQTGNTVSDWPFECYSGALADDYHDWRCQQITNLVEAVHNGLQQIKPEVKISAAVFSNYPNCKWDVGQDWVDWINKGYLDFVCPMDYTDDFGRFESLVSKQLDFIQRQIPLYPGIGATSTNSKFGAEGIIAQILTTRELDTSGYIIFNYSQPVAETILPDLSKGITAVRNSSSSHFELY